MTIPKQYPISEMAFLFPDVPDDERARLVASTANLGPPGPVTIWRNQVVDGRPFYEAALEAGVEPRLVFLDDSADPLTHIIENNVRGRNPDESARSVAAYNAWRISNSPWPGEDEDPCANLRTPLTQEEAARSLGVSRRTLTDAVRILDDGSPSIAELRQAVRRGRIKVSDGTQVVGLPQEVQRAALQVVLSGKSRTIREAARIVELEAARRTGAQPLKMELPASVADSATLYVSGLNGLLGQIAPASVDVVVTRAPSDAGSLSALSELADFAAHALGQEGLLVVLADAARLPKMLPKLKPRHLRWVSEFDLLYQSPIGSTGEPHWLGIRRVPLLVYGRDGCRLGGGDDVIEVPATRGGSVNLEQMLADGTRLVVERFARPGAVVCDPMLGEGSGVAQGALARGCTFIGAGEDRPCVERVSRELEQFVAERAAMPTHPEGQAYQMTLGQ